MKELLSRCPEKLHCPVPLETLLCTLFHFLTIRNYCHCTATTSRFPLADMSRFSFLPDIYHKEGEKCLLASIMYPKYSKHISSGIQNEFWFQKSYQVIWEKIYSKLNSGLKSRFIVQDSRFYIMYQLIYQKPAHFYLSKWLS